MTTACPGGCRLSARDALTGDTLAGRIMVCRGGEPSHLLPLTDEQAL